MRSLVLFGLLLGALLIPGRLQAAAPRIEVLAPRGGFTLSRVMVSFAIDLRERDDRASAASTRYRVRIADREGRRGWDSGWLAASNARGGRLLVEVDCGLDTTGAAAVSEIQVDVALEVRGVVHEPWRITFFPWADGRFRPFPEPQPWPEPIRAPELELDIVHAPPATTTIAPRATARQPMIIVIGPSPLRSRVSWGQLKSTYR